MSANENGNNGETKTTILNEQKKNARGVPIAAGDLLLEELSEELSPKEPHDNGIHWNVSKVSQAALEKKRQLQTLPPKDLFALLRHVGWFPPETTWRHYADIPHVVHKKLRDATPHDILVMYPMGQALGFCPIFVSEDTKNHLYANRKD